ncbi:N-acetylmuramoyl-L-alanine amidase [Sinosporangium album]|nr:N-acetylmuramoyl-L-alanine amidase [Sinosporangium album]
MDGNGWSDIAYNLLVCEHGIIWEGRGARVMSAANGEGRNTDHYAVCALLGTCGLVEPTDEILTGLRGAIDYLRQRGAGDEVLGHRDGYATSCPGEPLYAWVRAGAVRPVKRTWTEEAVRDLPLLRIGAGVVKDDHRRWDVKTLVALLWARGFPIPSGTDETVFSVAVAEAVRAFQRTEKLRPDAVVGPKTWTALLRL